jgi:hypothetical protein
MIKASGNLDVAVTNAPVDPATRSSLKDAGVDVIGAGEVQT